MIGKGTHLTFRMDLTVLLMETPLGPGPPTPEKNC